MYEGQRLCISLSWGCRLMQVDAGWCRLQVMVRARFGTKVSAGSSTKLHRCLDSTVAILFCSPPTSRLSRPLFHIQNPCLAIPAMPRYEVSNYSRSFRHPSPPQITKGPCGRGRYGHCGAIIDSLSHVTDFNLLLWVLFRLWSIKILSGAVLVHFTQFLVL